MIELTTTATRVIVVRECCFDPSRRCAFPFFVSGIRSGAAEGSCELVAQEGQGSPRGYSRRRKESGSCQVGCAAYWYVVQAASNTLMAIANRLTVVSFVLLLIGNAFPMTIELSHLAMLGSHASPLDSHSETDCAHEILSLLIRSYRYV